MSENGIEVVKKRIVDWLETEKLRPKEIPDSNAHFNIVAHISNLGFNIIQRKDKKDNIFIGTNLNFTPQQISLFKGMNEAKRQSYFWNLRMRLLNSPNLGSFEIKPHAPQEISVVFISSKPIFYDGLSKDRLLNVLFDVHKAVMMTVWLLEETSGSTSTSSMPSTYIS